MKQFILKRIFYSLLILFLVSILIFLLGRAGDPIQNASISTRMGMVHKEVIEALKVQFGLDKPLPVQYYLWISNFIRGDWGTSISYREDVREMFIDRLPITLELFAGSVFWSAIIGFPFWHHLRTETQFLD